MCRSIRKGATWFLRRKILRRNLVGKTYVGIFKRCFSVGIENANVSFIKLPTVGFIGEYSDLKFLLILQLEIHKIVLLGMSQLLLL